MSKTSSNHQQTPIDEGEENLSFHVTWESPVHGNSGYAASSRSALRGLDEAGARIRVIPLEQEKREAIDRS